jgi:hypothetical protein
MTIEITKGKLTRWIIIAVVLVCGTGDAVDVPNVAVAVVACREFMADFKEYGDYSLLDVYQWRPGFFGVVMLCPIGFKETLVYDTRDGKMEVIYRDVTVPPKSRREEMRRESILVADAVHLAKNAVEYQNNNPQK